MAKECVMLLTLLTSIDYSLIFDYIHIKPLLTADGGMERHDHTYFSFPFSFFNKCLPDFSRNGIYPSPPKKKKKILSCFYDICIYPTNLELSYFVTVLIRTSLSVIAEKVFILTL